MAVLQILYILTKKKLLAVINHDHWPKANIPNLLELKYTLKTSAQLKKPSGEGMNKFESAWINMTMCSCS